MSTMATGVGVVMDDVVVESDEQVPKQVDELN
jgi:hypothetical protein